MCARLRNLGLSVVRANVISSGPIIDAPILFWASGVGRYRLDDFQRARRTEKSKPEKKWSSSWLNGTWGCQLTGRSFSPYLNSGLLLQERLPARKPFLRSIRENKRTSSLSCHCLDTIIILFITTRRTQKYLWRDDSDVDFLTAVLLYTQS